MSTDAIARDPEIEAVPLTREQYDRMVDQGDFEGQHMELLEGVLVAMAPQGPEHWSTVARLGTQLTIKLWEQFGNRYTVGQQGPIAASARSEPEPDIVVVETSEITSKALPQRADLLIEVTKTSHRIDLVHKPSIYAHADVTEYWVVDLKARHTVVHRTPTENGYGDVESHPFDATLEVLGISVCIADLIG